MSSSMQHLGILGFGTRGTRASTIGPDRPPAIQTLFTPLYKEGESPADANRGTREWCMVHAQAQLQQEVSKCDLESHIVDEVAAVRIEAAMTEN